MSDATEENQAQPPEIKKKRRIPLFLWVLIAVLIWLVLFVWLTDRKAPHQPAQPPVVTAAEQDQAIINAPVEASPGTTETQQQSLQTTQPAQTPLEQAVEMQTTKSATAADSTKETSTDQSSALAETATSTANNAVEVPVEVLQQLVELFSPK